MTKEPKLPASPEIWPEAKPFWDAAAEGKLLIKGCRACGQPHFYPRPFCPFCLSADTEWVACSGRGVVYSFTVAPRAPVFQVPAMIALDEGPVMMSAIVEADPAQLKVGAPVEVGFTPSAGGQPIPVFRLRTAAAQEA